MDYLKPGKKSEWSTVIWGQPFSPFYFAFPQQRYVYIGKSSSIQALVWDLFCVIRMPRELPVLKSKSQCSQDKVLVSTMSTHSYNFFHTEVSRQTLLGIQGQGNRIGKGITILVLFQNLVIGQSRRKNRFRRFVRRK